MIRNKVRTSFPHSPFIRQTPASNGPSGQGHPFIDHDELTTAVHTEKTRHFTILAARYWPDLHGGVETHINQFSRELARSGVKVQVHTENRTDSPSREQLMPDLSVYRHDPPETGRLWRWAALVHVRWWLQLLKKHPPVGMIWASNTPGACAAILAGYRQRLIYNPAGSCDAMRNIAKQYPHVTTMAVPRLVTHLDRFAYRRAGRVVVSSQNVKDQFARFVKPRSQVDVQPLATVPAKQISNRATIRKQWGIDPHVFVMGFVGRLDPCKGVDFLFDAMQTARLRADTRLIIVGDGPDENRIRLHAQRAGVANSIVWTGRLADPAEAYAAMDTLILPSLYEAFGMVILEAMAAGVPVVARRGNGRTVMTASEEIIDHGHTGMIVEPHDLNELANTLHHLENDKSHRHAMGTAARFIAGQYTWQHYASRCLAMLNQPANTEYYDEYHHRAA